MLHSLKNCVGYFVNIICINNFLLILDVADEKMFSHFFINYISQHKKLMSTWFYIKFCAQNFFLSYITNNGMRDEPNL